MVYEGHRWGKENNSKYCSGFGSVGEGSRAYVEAMVPILRRLAEASKGETTIVDLGCGDFRVGAELVNRLPGIRYIGCDIVPGLIEENRKRFGSARVEFRCLDIVSEDLPEGQAYLVRQVLQHLPNLDIANVLSKLISRPYVFVTEGQPLVREGPVNPDKNIGASIRFDWTKGIGRGVELDQPPFNVPLEEIRRVALDPKFSREVVVTWHLIAAGTQSARNENAV